MKVLIVIAILMHVATSAEIFRANSNLNSEWQAYKQTHKKNYNSSNEENVRRQQWEQEIAKINAHNAQAASGNRSYTMATNEFTDKTEAEKQTLLGMRIPAKTGRHIESHIVDDQESLLRQSALPASVDLRNSSCMAAIKNQGQCGSCWAFAATNLVEYMNCIKYKQLVLLSESQLVNCSGSYGNLGCNGGNYYNAWSYINTAPSQAKAISLPYYAANGTCKFNNVTMRTNDSVTAIYSIPAKNSTAMMQVVATKGPVAVAMWVDTTTFYPYKSGVYALSTCPTDCAGKNMNHAVTVVGYGSANATTPYWIIRNQWGTSWGMAGYALIKRGANMCNIECSAAYIAV